jgi:hypothetical protein
MKTDRVRPSGCRERLAELENQISRLNRREGALLQISNKYWRARRIWLVVGIILTIGVYELGGDWTGLLAFLFSVGVFIGIAHFHGKVLASLRRNGEWISIKRSQMARIGLDWGAMPRYEQSRTIPSHPYELDLDITGETSLHRLLDVGMTIEGSHRLLDWLLNTDPDPEQISKRQALVVELSRLTLFREKLLLHSTRATEEIGGQWQSGRLLQWINRHEASRWLLPALIALCCLAVLNIGLFSLFVAKILPAYWLISALAYLAIMRWRSEDIRTSFVEATALEKALNQVTGVFSHLERYGHGNNPNLARLSAPFRDRQNRPSAFLKRLSRIAAALSLRAGNPFLWVWLQLIVPWDFYFSYRLRRCKTEASSLIPIWIDVWTELEALVSLANFAWLHQEYCMPDFILAGDSGDAPFVAKEIGHPLIRCDHKVTNDFDLGGDKRIAIITGSNMAGKSTFLRTLGINLVLAYAGGPVSAASLRTSFFRVFACIKVSDSLADGLSYFYAEVRRLRALLDSVKNHEGDIHFVLIDEIFRGTNNRERRIGSQQYIRALAEMPVVGSVATHDLELIKLEQEIPVVANYHFREEIADGKMVFDYKIHPGPCPTTNALRIMELEGLPVSAGKDA